MVKLSLVNLISYYWLSVFPYIELIGSIANIRASLPLRKLWSFPGRQVVPKFLPKKSNTVVHSEAHPDFLICSPAR